MSRVLIEQPGGKLEINSIPGENLLDVLRRAGAEFLGEDSGRKKRPDFTKADLFAAGLTGGEGSAQRRLELLKKLELPEHMGANALLAVLNSCYSAEEVRELLNL